MFPNRKARPAPHTFFPMPTTTDGEELDGDDAKKPLTTEKPPVVFTVQDSFPDSMEVRIPKFSPDDLLPASDDSFLFRPASALGTGIISRIEIVHCQSTASFKLRSKDQRDGRVCVAACLWC
jgi:hypothetical protein